MIELKLDLKAVQSLFPEGTEAHVSLQKAVVVELLKKVLVVKNQAPEDLVAMIEREADEYRQRIDEALADAKKLIMQKALAEDGVLSVVEKKTWQGTTTEIALTQQAKDAVRAVARLALNTEIEESIRETVKQRIDNMPNDPLWQNVIDRAVQKHVSDVVLGKVKAALGAS